MSFDPAWIVGQRLGSLGWSIIETDPAESQLKAKHLARLSQRFLEALAELGRLARGSALIELPLATLEICSNPVIAKRVPHAAESLTQMANLLAWYKRHRKHDLRDDRGNPFSIQAASPSEAAAIIAQMILFSDLPALPLASALKFFVSSDYAPLLGDGDKLQQLQQLLDAVRTPGLTIDEIAGRARRIVALLDQPARAFNYAIPIRNALFDALLAWPLLFYRDPGLEKGKPSNSSLSLPLIVDVLFDDQGAVQLQTAIAGDTETERHVLKLLADQARRAFHVAKQLWMAKNAHSIARKAEVERASCTIDFRLAEEVCLGASIYPIWAERSAEAYLVQLLLARLIGRQVGMTAGISGVIGDQMRERRRAELTDRALEDFSVLERSPDLVARYIAGRRDRRSFIEGTANTRDWQMQSIGGKHAKFRYASASRKFHKLILPHHNRITPDGASGEAYLEVNYARSHSGVADAAQVGGWRQHGYTRCPDLGHLIHSEPELLPPINHPFVAETRDALQNAEGGAVRLDGNHTMLSIAALLAHLNFDYRFKQSPIAPSLSWELVRAVPEELSSRFWHTFLKSIGASDLAIKEHFLNDSAEFTVDLIVSILNGGIKAQSLGCHAPPDLVVVFAAQHLWSKGLSEVERKEIPLDCRLVFDLLAERKIDPLREPFGERIGPCRVIFLDDDLRHLNPIYFKALPGTNTFRDALFERLSIFDRGFNLQLARIACGDLASDMTHLKAMLEEQVENGAIWRHGGHYFLPHALRRNPPVPSLELATVYKTLANALMPGLGRGVSSGYGTAECLEADIVREAQAFVRNALQTLEEVQKQAQASGNHDANKQVEDLRRIIRCEQGLHMRFFEMPTWGVLTQLNRSVACDSRPDVLIAAQSLLERARAANKVNPRSLTCCAQAAEKVASAALGRTDHETANRLLIEINNYFDEAEMLAQTYSDPTNRNDWLMHVLSWRLFLMRDYNRRVEIYSRRPGVVRPRNFSNRQIVECDTKIAEIFERDSESGIFPNVRWHNYTADRIADDQSASRYYRNAILVQPKFFESYLKAFGTLKGNEQQAVLNAEPGRDFWESQARAALSWYELNKESIGRIKSIPAVAKSRMAVGETELRRRLRLA